MNSRFTRESSGDFPCVRGIDLSRRAAESAEEDRQVHGPDTRPIDPANRRSPCPNSGQNSPNEFGGRASVGTAFACGIGPSAY